MLVYQRVPCILWIFMGDLTMDKSWFQSVSSSADSTVARWIGISTPWQMAILGCIHVQTQPFLSDCCEKISHSYPIHIPFISIRDRSTPLNHRVSPFHPPKIASSKLAAVAEGFWHLAPVLWWRGDFCV